MFSPLLKDIKGSVFHLLFPHICSGCGSDLLSEESQLCMRCMEALPETSFESHAANPVEKKFWGRLKIQSGTAQYYFTKESLIQHLMHQFKYRGNKELGIQMGKIMGLRIKQSRRFKVEALIPLPLFPAKEKRRGYNQATALCQGLSEILQIPVLDHVVTRPQYTDTQTRKGRIERWKNIEGKFFLADPDAIAGKNLLLVDDVVTTGATLESCGNELLKAQDVNISIATLCFAAN